MKPGRTPRPSAAASRRHPHHRPRHQPHHQHHHRHSQ